MPDQRWDRLWVDVNVATMTDASLGIIERGAVASSGERIAWVGPEAEIGERRRETAAEIIRCGGAWLTPGLIDRARSEGSDGETYLVGDAEDLDGLGDGEFDLAVSYIVLVDVHDLGGRGLHPVRQLVGAEPRAQGGSPDDDVARVHLDVPRGVGRRVGVQGANHAEVVGEAGEVGVDAADLQAALAVFLELER